MSTPTHARDAVQTTVVPRPRRAAEPAPEAEPPAPPVAAPRPEETGAGEPAGLFARHAWLTPAAGIALVLATFLAMVLLTWAAGGGTPFDR